MVDGFTGEQVRRHVTVTRARNWLFGSVGQYDGHDDQVDLANGLALEDGDGFIGGPDGRAPARGGAQDGDGFVSDSTFVERGRRGGCYGHGKKSPCCGLVARPAVTQERRFGGVRVGIEVIGLLAESGQDADGKPSGDCAGLSGPGDAESPPPVARTWLGI
jgi:hypothetical protein